MTASMRYATLNNTSGAALTEAKAIELQTDEKDYCLTAIERIFSAADIGTATGQSRDATDPTGGCLIARPVTGAKIKFVPTITITRSVAATGAGVSFDRELFSGPPTNGPYGVRISADRLTARLFDTGAGDNQLAAGDKMVITFALSNN